MDSIVGNLNLDQQKMHAIMKELESEKRQNELKDDEIRKFQLLKEETDLEIEGLRNRNEMMAQMDKQYASELESTSSRFEAKVQSLKKEFELERNLMLSQRKNEVSVLRNQIQALEKDNFELKAKILSSKTKDVSEVVLEQSDSKDHENPEGMVQIYKQRCLEAEEETSRLKEQILDLKTDLVKVQNQLEIEFNKSKYLEKNLHTIGGDKKSYLDDLQGLKNELVKRSNEIRKLISELEVSEKQVAHLEHEVKAGLKRESDLLREVEDYHQRLVSLSQEVKETSYVFNSDSNFKFEKENQTLLIQNETLKTKVEELLEINLDLKQKLTETEINQSLVSTDASIHLEALEKLSVSNQNLQLQLLASNKKMLDLESELLEQSEQVEKSQILEGEIILIRNLLANQELMDNPEGRKILTELISAKNPQSRNSSLQMIQTLVQKLLDDQVIDKFKPTIADIVPVKSVLLDSSSYFERLISLDSKFKELLLKKSGILISDGVIKVEYEVLNRLYTKNNEIDIRLSVTAKSDDVLLSHISFKSEGNKNASLVKVLGRVHINGQVTGLKLNRDQIAQFEVKFTPEDMANFLNPVLVISYSQEGAIYTQESVIPIGLFQIVLRVKSEHEKCSGIYENFSKSISIDIPFNQSCSNSKINSRSLTLRTKDSHPRTDRI